MTCSACNGSGRKTYGFTTGATDSCPTCCGSGQVAGSSNTSCKSCGGSGNHPLGSSYGKCGSCGGSGK
jgi:hypothetical protein